MSARLLCLAATPRHGPRPVESHSRHVIRDVGELALFCGTAFRGSSGPPLSHDIADQRPYFGGSAGREREICGALERHGDIRCGRWRRQRSWPGEPPGPGSGLHRTPAQVSSRRPYGQNRGCEDGRPCCSRRMEKAMRRHNWQAGQRWTRGTVRSQGFCELDVIPESWPSGSGRAESSR